MGCSDEEEDDMEVYEKIPEIEDELPVTHIEIINENVSSHSSESKLIVIHDTQMSVKDDCCSPKQARPVH